MTEMERGFAALREPFPPESVGKMPKPYKKESEKGNCSECGGYHGLPAMHLDYVGHAAVTHRLLDVDPGWSWEPVAFGDDGLPKFDHLGGLWIRLTILGTTRLGYGDAQGKTGPNAVKEAIGDALRNAALRFGVALDLWHKGVLPEPAPEYDDPGPFVDSILAATTLDELQTIAGRIASSTLLRGERTDLRAKWNQRKSEIEQQEATE